MYKVTQTLNGKETVVFAKTIALVEKHIKFVKSFYRDATFTTELA